MAGIFISYRRQESQEVAGRIYDYLTAHFPGDRIFKDVDSIPPGESFPEFIKAEIGRADVIIVVIGPQFATTTSEAGRIRLRDPADYFRIEIETALGLEKHVIPLLVSGARMPRKSELPPSLRRLADRNALEVRPDPDFRHHVGRLIAALDRQFGRVADRGAPLSEEEVYRRLNTLEPNRWRQLFGLQEVRASFHGFSYERLLQEAGDLLLVLNDGRSWIDSHRELLRQRIASSQLVTRVLLLHPDSTFIDVLIRKNGKSKHMQLEELRRSLVVLEEARQPASNLLVRAHYNFNPYSLHLTESEAVVSPYMLEEAGALPVFVFVREATHPIYLQFKEDAERAFAKALPLSSLDVPIA